MSRALPLSSAALLLALSVPAASQTTHTIHLRTFSFDVPSPTIAMGDTVSWVWDTAFHNVESGVNGVADGNFSSGAPVFPPMTFSVTFDADFLAANTMPNGAYPYYCIVHIGFFMTGTITVQAPLLVDDTTISLASGGTQVLSLDAGLANANQLYWMVGTTAGFSPGLLGLPLNFSNYMLFTFNSPNLLIANGLDFLDATGKRTAAFTLPPGLDPGLAGVVFHHAYAAIDVFTLGTLMVSNAQSLTLVP